MQIPFLHFGHSIVIIACVAFWAGATQSNPTSAASEKVVHGLKGHYYVKFAPDDAFLASPSYDRDEYWLPITKKDPDAAIQRCITKHAVTYPVLRGNEATQHAWTGGSQWCATFFVTPDGTMLKGIVDSIDNGIEPWVFPKYANFLLAAAPKGVAQKSQ